MKRVAKPEITKTKGDLPYADRVTHEKTVAKRRRRSVKVPSPDDSLQCLRKSEVAALLGVTVWTIDHWRRHDRFPAPVRLSDQVVVWRRGVVEEWLRSREVQ